MSYIANCLEFHNQMLKSDYYIHNYRLVIANAVERTCHGVDEWNAAEWNSIMNDFWAFLPDSPEIRTGPFFKLCDLCEMPDDNE